MARKILKAKTSTTENKEISTKPVKRKRNKKLKSGDFPLVILTMGILIFGIIMVFSASYYTSINDAGNPYAYLIRDCAWACVGVVVMVIAATVDYHIYYKFAKPIMYVSIVLLLLLLTPLGIERNYAVRWLGVGEITIMPGELAKPAAIIFTSWFLSRNPKIIKSFTKGVLPLMLLCIVYAALIIIQPNLSTAITVCIIIVGIMFAAGLNYIYVGGVIGAGALGIVGLLTLRLMK